MNKLINKILLPIFILILGLYASAGQVTANEGKIEFEAGSVSCRGISIWQSDKYKITGRCQGLVYPYAERLDSYVLWANLEDGSVKRLDDVPKGMIDAQIKERFTGLFITAEESTSPKSPSDIVVVSGALGAIGFDQASMVQIESDSVDEQKSTTPTPTPAQEITAESAEESKLDFSKLLGSTTTVIVLIISLVVVLLGIISFTKR